MGKKVPAVDAYIAHAAPYAQPILKRLRKLVHEGCPDVEESLKWGHPSFGHTGILCGMAAFKQYCTFGFWKSALLTERHKDLSKANQDAMGQLGRITAVADLPSDKTLLRWIKDAAALNEAGIKPPPTAKKKKPPVKVPDYFRQALEKNKKAQVTFDAFSPSCKREYVEWITEAKQLETRQRRLDQALVWMAQGKARNWKYMK